MGGGLQDSTRTHGTCKLLTFFFICDPCQINTILHFLVSFRLGQAHELWKLDHSSPAHENRKLNNFTRNKPDSPAINFKPILLCCGESTV